MIFQGRGAPKIDVFLAPVREPPPTPPREAFFRIRAVLGPFYGHSLGWGGVAKSLFRLWVPTGGPNGPKMAPWAPEAPPRPPKSDMSTIVGRFWTLFDPFVLRFITALVWNFRSWGC